MSFETLKRNRGANISKIVQAAQATNTGETKSYVDERIWKPTVDKAGNGYAVLRFLPGKDGEIPFVRYWDHGFKGPTGLWYIENSLTSIGQTDPVGELNSKLWNSGVETDKEIARKQKRKLQYYSNIYVVSDSANPQNEGKVFLYRFGKKIFDKVMEAMQPAFEDETPVNPFDFWEGANFKLKLRKVDGYWNYDKSEFDAPSALLDGDDESLEEVFNKQYSLAEFTALSNFKSYDELKTRLDMVLSGTVAANTTVETLMEDEPTATTSVDTKEEPAPKNSVVEDDNEDAMSYFEKLVADEEE